LRLEVKGKHDDTPGNGVSPVKREFKIECKRKKVRALSNPRKKVILKEEGKVMEREEIEEE